MKCPKCQADNPDTQSYCGDCGTKLVSEEQAPAFTKTLETPFPQLSQGTTLADRYKILGELGKGGMGEVYLAEDTNLRRQVAIKVLPQQFALDKGRLARFEREARLLASLNHPNIATIHGLEKSDGQQFLVMELIEGETLRERIRKGPLSVEGTLEICKQLADGLESAHEKGIIHRDLKPANIKVTPEGKVKILDFGIAKVFQDQPEDSDPSQSQVTTDEVTRPGSILGTVAYMSPEQAKGNTVDKRSDIWAFGCILYECLTRKRAYEGETTSETIASILKGEPEWNELPTGIPLGLRTLIRRCLEKNQKNRLHDIADARIEIEEVLSKPLIPGVGSFELAGVDKRRRISPQRIPWMIVAVVTVAAVFAFWQWFRHTSPKSHPVTRFVLSSLSDYVLSGAGPRVAISPDGTTLICVAWADKTTHLFIRKIYELEASIIPGTEGAYSPFFSPDGQWVGFISGGNLKKVALKGGPPLTIVKNLESVQGASWGTNDIIVYAPTNRSGLHKVSAAGGIPQEITKVNEDHGEISHRWPEILPDGKAALFSIYKGSLEDMQIGVVSLETGEKETLIEAGCQSRYITTGHIVYTVADGSLLAVPFNLSRLKLTGSATPIMEGIVVRSEGSSDFNCSLHGSLVYVGGVTIEKALIQVDRQGTERVLSDKSYNYHPPSLSPDDKKIAISIPSKGIGDIWIYEIEQDTLTRLTYEGDNQYPVWTPDGRRVAFSSNKEGTYDLYWKLADFSSPAEPLYTSQIAKYEITFDPDENFLVFRQTDPTTGRDIWILPLDGKHTPRPFLNTSFMECSPMLSPDGRWLAYVSDETGKSEVYVRSFPDPSGIRRQVSVEGGIEPRWAKNGKELFYRSSNHVFAATVETEPTFSVLARVALFEDNYWYSGARTAYDVNTEGTWFVMLKGLEQSSEVIVVQNWFEELKRLIPKGE